MNTCHLHKAQKESQSGPKKYFSVYNINCMFVNAGKKSQPENTSKSLNNETTQMNIGKTQVHLQELEQRILCLYFLYFLRSLVGLT